MLHTILENSLKIYFCCYSLVFSLDSFCTFHLQRSWIWLQFNWQFSLIVFRTATAVDSNASMWAPHCHIPVSIKWGLSELISSNLSRHFWFVIIWIAGYKSICEAIRKWETEAQVQQSVLFNNRILFWYTWYICLQYKRWNKVCCLAIEYYFDMLDILVCIVKKMMSKHSSVLLPLKL